MVVREPAEKTCGVLLFWLREMIDLCLIRRFSWCDTRDLSCDGNTKGSISREALLDLMTLGKHLFQHPVESYKNRRVPDRKPPGQTGENNQKSSTKQFCFLVLAELVHKVVASSDLVSCSPADACASNMSQGHSAPAMSKRTAASARLPANQSENPFVVFSGNTLT